MADRVLTISLRLTSLCGVVYAAVTASYISCFVWMGTLIGMYITAVAIYMCIYIYMNVVLVCRKIKSWSHFKLSIN